VGAGRSFRVSHIGNREGPLRFNVESRGGVVKVAGRLRLLKKSRRLDRKTSAPGFLPKARAPSFFTVGYRRASVHAHSAFSSVRMTPTSS
jgi:hypothetical protein